jgi:hypothetical protein
MKLFQTDHLFFIEITIEIINEVNIPKTAEISVTKENFQISIVVIPNFSECRNTFALPFSEIIVKILIL